MKNKTFHRILEMAKPHKKTILVITILSLLINVGEILKPYLIKIVIKCLFLENIIFIMN